MDIWAFKPTGLFWKTANQPGFMKNPDKYLLNQTPKRDVFNMGFVYTDIKHASLKYFSRFFQSPRWHMTYDELCAYLLRHPGAVKEFPLGADLLAFKVDNKIFALLALDKKPYELTLKYLDTHKTLYPHLLSHMTFGAPSNQPVWITLQLDQQLPLNEVLNLIDESYELVLKQLKKSTRDKIQFEKI